MQALLRAIPPARFPEVARFVEIHRDGRFAAPLHVACYLLDLAFGPFQSAAEAHAGARGAVIHRVPEEGP